MKGIRNGTLAESVPSKRERMLMMRTRAWPVPSLLMLLVTALVSGATLDADQEKPIEPADALWSFNTHG